MKTAMCPQLWRWWWFFLARDFFTILGCVAPNLLGSRYPFHQTFDRGRRSRTWSVVVKSIRIAGRRRRRRRESEWRILPGRRSRSNRSHSLNFFASLDQIRQQKSEQTKKKKKKKNFEPKPTTTTTTTCSEWEFQTTTTTWSKQPNTHYFREKQELGRGFSNYPILKMQFSMWEHPRMPFSTTPNLFPIAEMPIISRV